MHIQSYKNILRSEVKVADKKAIIEKIAKYEKKPELLALLANFKYSRVVS